ncbi:MAG: hypothetical protein ACFFHV_17920 [Promethearchaeota archaeon]
MNKNFQIKRFLKETEGCDVLIKKLNQEEVRRINSEYPYFLKKENFGIIKQGNKLKSREIISCLTLIKKDMSDKNYVKLNKIKLYINELDGKIIKTLQS